MGDVVQLRKRRRATPGARVFRKDDPQLAELPELVLRDGYADPALGLVMQAQQGAVQVIVGAADGEVELWLEPAAARRLMAEIGRCADDAERAR